MPNVSNQKFEITNKHLKLKFPKQDIVINKTYLQGPFSSTPSMYDVQIQTKNGKTIKKYQSIPIEGVVDKIEKGVYPASYLCETLGELNARFGNRKDEPKHFTKLRSSKNKICTYAGQKEQQNITQILKKDIFITSKNPKEFKPIIKNDIELISKVIYLLQSDFPEIIKKSLGITDSGRESIGTRNFAIKPNTNPLRIGRIIKVKIQTDKGENNYELVATEYPVLLGTPQYSLNIRSRIENIVKLYVRPMDENRPAEEGFQLVYETIMKSNRI